MGRADELEAFRKRAYSYAYSLCKNREEAQDLASDAVLEVLEHPSWKFNDVKFRVTDAIRKHLGKDSGVHNANRKNIFNPLRIEPWMEKSSSSFEKRIIEKDLITKRLNALNDKERFICLKILEGFSQLEISKMLGVTDSRVYQIYAEALMYLDSLKDS